MNFFNILDHKYTDDKIKTALAKWSEYSKNEPKERSIESRLMKNSTNNQTNILIYRKYPLYEKFTFPSHYYMTIDDKIWHPGYGDDENIFQQETIAENSNNRNGIIEIKEKCNYCVYWELYKNFQSDRHFNLMSNNCQVIMGMFAETICILIIAISLIATTITGYYVFLLIALFFFLVLFIFSLSTHCTQKFRFSTCIHIRPIHNY